MTKVFWYLHAKGWKPDGGEGEGGQSGREKQSGGGQAWGHHLSAACLVFPFGLPWGGAVPRYRWSDLSAVYVYVG